MQITSPKHPKGLDPPNEGEENVTPNEKKQKKMAWLYLSRIEGREENDLGLNGVTNAVKTQIGSYYYWIRLLQSIPELCRLAVRRDSLILYEVLQHDNLGITDDDLEDAVRQDNGELILAREYRISNHIKRKLQVLYAP